MSEQIKTTNNPLAEDFPAKNQIPMAQFLENSNGILLSGLFIQLQHVQENKARELPERWYFYMSTGINQYRINISNNTEMLNLLSAPQVFMGMHISVFCDVTIYNNALYFIRPRLVELGGTIQPAFSDIGEFI